MSGQTDPFSVFNVSASFVSFPGRPSGGGRKYPSIQRAEEKDDEVRAMNNIAGDDLSGDEKGNKEPASVYRHCRRCELLFRKDLGHCVRLVCHVLLLLLLGRPGRQQLI